MSEPTWMQAARAQIGTQEVTNGARIVGWAKSLGGWIASYFTDAHTIPWCGLFVDMILTGAGFKTLGDKSLGALNWATWGQPMTAGAVGALLVFKRKGGGHVGFYVAEDDTAYHVLGGNQGDKVCIERLPKANCVAIRWPDGQPATPRPVLVSPQGVPLSVKQD